MNTKTTSHGGAGRQRFLAAHGADVIVLLQFARKEGVYGTTREVMARRLLAVPVL